MKYFELDEREYAVEKCTAICDADLGNENARQEALIVTYYHNGEKFEDVVFGWEMPENDEEFKEMCYDSWAWDSNYEVIETVVKIAA